MYQEPDARSPFDRSATNGIRLVKFLSSEPLPENLTASVSLEMADYRNVKPVSDAIFQVYQAMYAYDRLPLDAKVETEDDSSPYWRRQRITFNATYGNEHVIAYLFFPRKRFSSLSNRGLLPSQWLAGIPFPGRHANRVG
jgi:eukaryotic-like serine/threonine-protein kinase